MEFIMFVVTGITGQVGAAVATHLLKEGADIRAVARNPAKAEIWKERGCDLVTADLTDTAALTAAFTGAEAVFLVIPPVFDPSPDFSEVRQLLSTLKAALAAAKPDKLVCLSTIGAQASEPNLLSQLGLVEKELATLQMPVAFLRAAWFMENSAWDVTPSRENGVMPSFLQPLDRPVPMVAVDDIGALGAKLLREEWQGVRIVELEGPERVTPNRTAAAFARAIGRDVKAEAVPAGSWKALFRAQGMSNPTPRMRMLDGFNEGWIEFEDRAHVLKGETDIETVVARLVAAG